jgi:membrane fusion protein, copper/silver efflux system
MKIRYRIIIILFVAAGFFLLGAWANHHGTAQKSGIERKVLYYVDPMNPAFKSDKPGIAPCGMALDPVYEDSTAAGNRSTSHASMPPGTIRISPEQQQLIGVRLATVAKTSWGHSLRVLGRVVPDETRVYRINAAVNGWIVDALPVTTGSLVKKINCWPPSIRWNIVPCCSPISISPVPANPILP